MEGNKWTVERVMFQRGTLRRIDTIAIKWKPNFKRAKGKKRMRNSGIRSPSRGKCIPAVNCWWGIKTTQEMSVRL